MAGHVPTVGQPPEAMPGHVPSAIPPLMFTFSIVSNTIHAYLERDMRLAGKRARHAGFAHNRAIFTALFCTCAYVHYFSLETKRSAWLRVSFCDPPTVSRPRALRRRQHAGSSTRGERIIRCDFGRLYNNGFSASRCHISSRFFCRSLLGMTP
jgi:hypothetical protein